MTAVAIPVRARLFREVFTRLPISGRYLSGALRAAAIDLAALPSPMLCRDRWNEFSVEIKAATDIIERHILFQGYFEYRESLFIRRTLKPGQLFLDIGANIGWHSLLAAARVGAKGRVLAFEPATRAYDHLVRNARLNRFTQLQAFHYGLSTRDAVFDIYPCEEANSGANSLYSPNGSSPIEQVKVRRGDEVLQELRVGNIDLCKIDVEGAEIDVLGGLRETLAARRIRALMIEINPESLARANRTPAELISLLTEHGFSLRDIRSGQAVNRAEDLRGGLNVVGQLA